MEEVDLKMIKRLLRRKLRASVMQLNYMELHKKYDSDKKPHKKKKTAKNNAGHFSDYLERKAKENMETKRCCKQQSTYHYLPDCGDYSYIISDF